MGGRGGTIHYQRKLCDLRYRGILVLLEGCLHLTQYKVCGKCPRCGTLNFLDSVNDENYGVREPLLMSILHAVICISCGRQFGTQTSPQLVREPEPANSC